MTKKELKEITLRIGVLTLVPQRVNCIEENEKIVNLEFDEQTNLISLFLEDTKK